MSGTNGVLLTTTRDGQSMPRLPTGRDPSVWHAALTREIATHLTPAHAALLGTPVRQGNGWDWYCPGHAVLRYGDLPPADRRLLGTAIGSILSDIRRLAERGRAPTVAAAWPGMREVPDLAHVFAVDGRPVLAGWGYGPDDGGHGPLGRMDDGVPWRAEPRHPWGMYCATLAAIAAFALAAGLLLPIFGYLLLPAPTACLIAPGQLALLAEQNRAIDRNNELKRLQAALEDELGRKRMQCPLPVAPPPPAPQRQADLPRDRWDRHDLSMFKGCWRSTTDLSTRDIATGKVRPVDQWRLCFDNNGHGSQSIRWKDGTTCQGPLAASFTSANHLLLTDTNRCAGHPNSLVKGRQECERISDMEANCIRTDMEGPNINGSALGRFLRLQ